MNGNTRSWFDMRYVVVAVVAFLGFWLLRVSTSSDWGAGAQVLALIAGIVLFIGAAVMLVQGERAEPVADVQIRQPGIASFLFNSTRSAPLWLGARVYLGYEWFNAGRHKFTDDAWMDGGAALHGYWERAVNIPEGGRPAITYGFYREYIQYMLDNGWASWFAKIIVYGELLIGIGLIVGALTGFAAFFGALMNMSFMLAGSASTNPILFSLSIAIILAWRVAGLIGLDRWLLPALGAPWSPGRLVRRDDERISDRSRPSPVTEGWRRYDLSSRPPAGLPAGGRVSRRQIHQLDERSRAYKAPRTAPYATWRGIDWAKAGQVK